MIEPKEVRNIAIACQGGGAQTAFTAGALSWLLKKYSNQDPSKSFRIVALSGTSGGAVCASLAWDDLLFPDRMSGNYKPTVEAFWRTGYPNRHAALPFPTAIAEDVSEFLTEGRLPWLHTVDRFRAELGMIGIQAPSLMMTPTPFDATFELKPYHFNNIFELIDTMTLLFMVNPMFDLIGEQLTRISHRPPDERRF
jgi:NTE family protein